MQEKRECLEKERADLKEERTDLEHKIDAWVSELTTGQLSEDRLGRLKRNLRRPESNTSK
jgi:hypothetical protein